MSIETLDVGQANELKLAFRRNGWTNEEIKRLSEGDILGQFRRVLLGFAEIKPVEHLINCDAAPFVPSGWSLASESEQLPNRVRGPLKWNPTKVQLYLSSEQRSGSELIVGHELQKKLADKKLVLTANVLDYLLANPHLIPEAWKGKAVFFWGTIYRGAGGGLCVRCLCWGGSRWYWLCSWLGGQWSGGGPAALRAS